jgi:hypothetical protein
MGMGEVDQASPRLAGAEGELHGVGGVTATDRGGAAIRLRRNGAVELGFSPGGDHPHRNDVGQAGDGIGEVFLASERGD